MIKTTTKKNLTYELFFFSFSKFTPFAFCLLIAPTLFDCEEKKINNTKKKTNYCLPLLSFISVDQCI